VIGRHSGHQHTQQSMSVQAARVVRDRNRPATT
jgi:hypothetical protein